MELKVGMYVRTEKGIIFRYYPCKNTEYDKENNIYHEWDDWGEYDDYYIITKASENIIDLIEVGDYVNGYKVIDIIETDVCGDEELTDRNIIIEQSNPLAYNRAILSDDIIENIVTKEQFDSMKYVVERNK